MFSDENLQACIKLLDSSLSSIGWRRGQGRGGAFLLVSPLLGPLPARSSRGEDGELDAALENFRRENFLLAKIGRDDAESPSSLKVQGWFAIPQLQLNVREPRENRGRLRHCNGLQTPTMPLIAAWLPQAGLGRRERGQTRSQDIGLAVLVRRPVWAADFSDKEKDETRPLDRFPADSS